MSLMQRVKSAVIFFIVFVFGLVNRWTFLVVFSAFMIVQLSEFLRFADLRGYSPLRSAVYLLGMLTFFEFFVIAQAGAGLEILLLVVGGIFLTFVVELFRGSQTPMENLSFTILALIYIALPFSMLNFIVFSPHWGYVFNYRLLFVFFLLIWATDIGAYFIGSRFGRHPLFKKISPKKSVEGLIGGTVSVFAVAFAIAYVFDFFMYRDAFYFAAIIAVFGTIGDLVESMFKRQVGLKDSGNIMPGHGGLLDRFDSTLLTAPFIVLYLYW